MLEKIMILRDANTAKVLEKDNGISSNSVKKRKNPKTPRAWVGWWHFYSQCFKVFMKTYFTSIWSVTIQFQKNFLNDFICTLLEHIALGLDGPKTLYNFINSENNCQYSCFSYILQFFLNTPLTYFLNIVFMYYSY